jgi:hypothetical protein
MTFEGDRHTYYTGHICCKQTPRQIVVATVEEQGREEGHVKDGGTRLEMI